MENLDKTPETISGMFDSIAGHYDALDHILSFGADILWRKRLVRRLEAGTGKCRVADIACGTGDLTIELARKGFEVTGLDLTRGMLDVAKKKYVRAFGNEPKLVLASAAETPFENGAFDAATISFGIRNFDDRPACLSEIARILKPGGVLAILEFAIPRNRIWRGIYLFYFKHILPRIGALISRNGQAYRYLPQSVMQFPKYGEFCSELQNSGFKEANFTPLMGGIAVIYFAHKA